MASEANTKPINVLAVVDRWPGYVKLAALLERLPKSDPVHIYAQAALRDDGAPTGGAIDQLAVFLRGPREYDWRTKAAAALVLGRVAPKTEDARRAAKALAGLLDGEFDPPAREASRRVLRSVGLATGCWMAALVAGLSASALPPPYLGSGDYLSLDALAGLFGYVMLFSAVLLIPGGVIGPLLAGLVTTNRIRCVRDAAAISLGCVAETDAIPALARASRESYSTLSYAARDALFRSASDLAPEHYGRFPRHTVDDLCRLLTDDLGWSSRILWTLELIGDGRALKPIEFWAQQATDPQLREQADRTLTAIRYRLQHEREAGRLLRAAESQPGEADLLLRADTVGHDSAPDALLRAVSGEGGSSQA